MLDELMWNDPPTVLAAVRNVTIGRADTSVFHAGAALAAEIGGAHVVVGP